MVPKTLKMIVACYNASGEPDLFFFIMRDIPVDDYDDGDHYDAACAYAVEQDYDAKDLAVVFDEKDNAGKAMLPLFQWDTATIVDYDYCSNL